MRILTIFPLLIIISQFSVLSYHKHRVNEGVNEYFLAQKDTVIEIIPLADAKVNSAASEADINFGEIDDFIVRNKPDEWGFESYLLFDVSGLDTATVTDAKLQVYGRNPNNSNIVQVTVIQTDTNWKELEITYNNSPAKVGVGIDTVAVNDTLQYYEWDLGGLIQDELNKGSSLISFVLSSTNADTLFDRAKFRSKEAMEFLPKLVLSMSDTVLTTSLLPLEHPSNPFTIYPNPATSNFHISFDMVQRGDMFITLRDIHGKKVYQDNVRAIGQAPELIVDVAHLSDGMYFVELQSGDQYYIDRVVKSEQ